MMAEHNTWVRATALPWRRALSILLLVLGTVTGVVSSSLSAHPASAPEDRPEATKLQSLWEALGDNQADVVQQALDALLKSPDEALSMIERQFAPLLGGDGPQVQDLIRALGDNDPVRQSSAEQQLSVLSKLIKTQLLQTLQGTPPEAIRSRVEGMLKGMTGPFTRSDHDRRLVRVGQLLTMLNTPRSRKLFEILEPTADLELIDERLPPLFDLLKSQRVEDHATAALYARKLGKAAAPLAPHLVKLLLAKDVEVDVEGRPMQLADLVADLLPRLGPGSSEALVKLLADHPDDPDTKLRAATALGRLGDERATLTLAKLLVDSQDVTDSKLKQAFEALGSKAMPEVIRALEKNELQFNHKITELLAQSGDARAVEALANTLQSNDPQQRKAAVHAILACGHAGFQAMLAIWQRNEPPLRDDTQLKLDLLTYPRHDLLGDRTPVIDLALRDNLDALRSSGLAHISLHMRDNGYDPKYFDLVLPLLKDPSPKVRRSAVYALGNFADHQNDAKLDEDQVSKLLLDAYNDAEVQVRQAALSALGSWKFPQAFELVVKQLDDPALAEYAAQALASMKDPRALAPLRERLPQKKSYIISALGYLRDRESVEQIITTINDPDWGVRVCSVQALEHIKDDRSIEALINTIKTDGPSQGDALNSLSLLDEPRAIQPMIDLCRRRSQHARAMNPKLDWGPLDHDGIARSLSGMGQAAVEPLAKALADEEPRVREVAAWALHEMRDGDIDDEDLRPVSEALAKALSDESRFVRCYVAILLSKLGDKRAAQVLLKELAEADNKYYIDEAAAWQLGQRPDPTCLPKLLELLDDPVAQVRANAARTLRGFHDSIVVEPLIGMLHDSGKFVRLSAIFALGHLKADAAADPLLEVLNEDDIDVRRMAVETLGRLKVPGTADGLAALLKDEDFDLRVAAVQALVQLGDARGVVELKSLLTNENADLRQKAYVALKHRLVDGETHAALLSAGLNDPLLKVRSRAAEALLHNRTPSALDALLRKADALLQESEDLLFVSDLCESLGHSKDPRAYLALAKMLAVRNDRMNSQALRFIDQYVDSPLPAPVVEALIVHLDVATPYGRKSVCRVFAHARPPQALEPLAKLLQDEDPQVRAYAARAIERIKQ